MIAGATGVAINHCYDDVALSNILFASVYVIHMSQHLSIAGLYNHLALRQLESEKL